MESDDDDRRFAGEGGEALELDGDYDSEEEVEEDEEEEMPPQRKPQPNPTQPAKPVGGQGAAAQQKGKPGGSPPGKADVKGQKVENQPFDLAVEVNDSEEIDSDEEEDEVHVGTTQTQAQQKSQQQQM